MEDAADAAHSLAPPLKIVRAHGAPPIERDPPVLTPLSSEGVVFKVRFGRRATKPVQHAFIRLGEHVGAAIADTEWNIALLAPGHATRPMIKSEPMHRRPPLEVT